MKSLIKILAIIIPFCLSYNVQAQYSTMGYSFQGYAIDGDGKAISDESISVRISIGGSVFVEEHNSSTDAFGVFQIVIGKGTATTGNFSELNFTDQTTAGIHNLKVEVKTGTGAFVTIHNGPLASVPYARAAANGVPVGTIVAFGGQTNKVPEGWVLCDGASQSTTGKFKQLFDAIGHTWGGTGSSFNLPNLGGKFLRGVGGSSAALGVAQGDLIKNHTHPVSGSTNNDGVHRHTKKTNNQIEDDGDGGYGIEAADGEAANHTSYTEPNEGHHIHAFSTTSDNNTSGGAETRPINVAVNYIIKY